MKPIRILLAGLATVLGTIAYAQSPSYYDLTFLSDSTASPYKASNSAHAYVRSKRGTDGVNPTPSADSAKAYPVTKIVLVFSEDSPDARETREEYNQERWENLMLTYPEFFQAKTTYKNICQCSPDAANDEYKQAQGFYIYYTAPAAAAPKKVETPVAKQETPAAEPPAKKTETPPAKTEAPVTKTEAPPAVKTETPPATKTETPVTKTETKTPEPVAKEEPKKEAPKETEATETEKNDEVAETTSKKKPAGMKPRKAKDPKACRPACYGYGDDDLVSYFKNSISLTKKQKKQAKKLNADLRIQLNIDGSVKKVMLTCENEELNKIIQDAVKTMGNWNAAVKNGVTIKSEVRMVLRFDKETKSIKPFDVVCNPKLGPKCKCMTDGEMFGD